VVSEGLEHNSFMPRHKLFLVSRLRPSAVYPLFLLMFICQVILHLGSLRFRIRPREDR